MLRVQTSKKYSIYAGWPKNGTVFVERFNIVKYLPIFKILSLSESGKNVNNIITKDPITNQACRYTTL